MSFLPGFEPALPATDNHDGKGNEWFTPPDVVRAVRMLCPDGVIDLDPCYCELGVTDARHRIDIRDGGNGLTDPWLGEGLAFVNPPFEDPGPWLARCVSQARRRDVVALVPFATNTNYWFAHVWTVGGHVVIHRGRLAFVGTGGQAHAGAMVKTCFVVWSADLAARLCSALRAVGFDAVALGVLPTLEQELPW